MSNRLCISLISFLVASLLPIYGLSLRAQSTTEEKTPEIKSTKQEDTKEAKAVDDETDKEIQTTKSEDDQKKPLTAAEIEYNRRMDSLKKSIEKEERPARPSFNKPKAKGKKGSITFDDIKFEMEKGQPFSRDMLTNEINGLVGQKISIKGFIRPNNKNRGLKKFVFVRDDKECCFGPGAALYDCVLVTLAKGKESDFTVRPITVEGEFYLKEFKGPDRRIWAVYRMNNCRVVK